MNEIGRLMCQRNESCVLIGPDVNAVSVYKSCGRHDGGVVIVAVVL
jgi:hypothetical protein